MALRVRPATAADLPALLRLQTLCHAPQLLESEACLASILAHACSFVACAADADADADDAVLAYALAHPGASAPLGALLPPPSAGGGERSCGGSGCFFLHDVCVAPHARGGGVARALVAAALARAAALGAHEAHLVALPGTVALWARFGFAPLTSLGGGDGDDDAASYGSGATHCRAALLPQNG
jgi:GNAT superfamily N-acetyltransferase